MFLQLLAAVLGFALTLGIMPRAIRIAREHAILDFPNEGRRIHGQPVPRIGGVAIFFATAIAVAATFAWARLDNSVSLPASPHLPGVALGCLIVLCTGIVDDAKGVTPAMKLAAQTLAALAAIWYGFRIDAVTLGGSSFFPLGVLALPVTILWMVGVTNAFNLIDGVDALAGTMALIGLATCVAVDLIVHDASALVITFALLGAVFAFLRHNRPPAAVFLGDSGSMLLGYWLSYRTVTASTIDGGVTFALVPLFALAFPLSDTFVAIARRWLRGHAFSRADGRHIHHQLLLLGLSTTRTVALLGLVFFSVAFMGVSIVFAPPQVTLALGTGGAVLAFIVFFYGIRWLRYSEFQEFAASVQSVLINARSHVRNKVVAGEIATRLVKAQSLDEVRAMLATCAAEFNLLEVTVIPGAQHFPQPAALQISPPSRRPFRVDYPIAWEEDGRPHEVVLRIWCERPDDKRHIGAERIATRLGGALEQWLAAHPGAFGVPPTTSGEHAVPRTSPLGVRKLDS